MLNLVRQKRRRYITGIQYSSHILHVYDAVHKVIVDLHMNDILPHGREVKVCLGSRPINTPFSPGLVLRPERQSLTWKCCAIVHVYIQLSVANLTRKSPQITTLRKTLILRKRIYIQGLACQDDAANPYRRNHHQSPYWMYMSRH